MCGIAGLLNLNQAPVDEQLLRVMTDTLRHRGPGGDGLLIDGCIGLGYRRLATLETSPAGRYPMADREGRAWIVYDGEVYNHRELLPDLQARGYLFHSATDIEVVLNSYLEYGVDCLRRFNGIWSLAIWDRARQQLLCARDRFGSKPFYYTWDEQQFRFASEIKALLADPGLARRPNHMRVMDFLFSSLTDHTHETMFAGVHQLPPAHYLIISQSGLSVQRYWSLAAAQVPASTAEQTERFRDLFIDAVRLRLRGEAPVGSCLSGGLDSSAIVCVADQLLKSGEGSSLGTQQKTFSACFHEPAIDERPHMRAVLEQTRTEGHQVFPTSTDITANLQEILWHQDEPFASPSSVAQWLVMKRARQAQVVAMLDGQGSDEMLAGYDPHWLPYVRDLLAQRRWPTLLWEMRRASHMLKLAALQRPLSEALPDHLYARLWPHARQRLFPGLSIIGGPAPPRHSLDKPTLAGEPSALNRTLYRDIQWVRLPGLLHSLDRNAMAHSIQARSPFLDHRLVEYAFGLPLAQKRWRGETKVVLRHALGHIMPASVVRRRDKIGFATPTSLLLDPPFRELVDDTIHSTGFKQRPYFDWQEAEQAWHAFLKGRHELHRAVWLWLITEQWLRTFRLET